MLALRQQQRYNKQAGAKTPSVNDVVLIDQEKQPRQLWRLGRIVELITSNDNEIRHAKVIVSKTKNIIDRHINRLYPLEMSNKVLNVDDGEPYLNVDKVGELRELAFKDKNFHVSFCIIVHRIYDFEYAHLLG